MLTCAADIIYMLGWELDETKKPSRQTELFAELTAVEKKIFEYLKEREKVG